eukprot:Opistho-2@83358
MGPCSCRCGARRWCRCALPRATMCGIFLALAAIFGAFSILVASTSARSNASLTSFEQMSRKRTVRLATVAEHETACISRTHVALATGLGLLNSTSVRTSNTSAALFVGDISFGRDIQSIAFNRYHGCFTYVFDYVRDILLSGDVTVANLESPLVGIEEWRRWAPSGIKKRILMRGHPDGAHALAWAGIDVVNLSNNHVFDYGGEGVNETMARLARVGVQHVGITFGRKAVSSGQVPAVHRLRNGVTLVMLSYCMLPTLCARDRRLVDAGPAIYTDDAAYADVRAVQAAYAGKEGIRLAIAVSLHWGVEYRTAPDGFMIGAASHFAGLGVDIVHGHHQHVLLGHSFYRKRGGGHTFVMFGTGNFVFDSHTCWNVDGTRIQLEDNLACDRLDAAQKQSVPLEVRKTRIYRAHMSPEGSVVSAEYLPCTLVRDFADPIYQPAPVDDAYWVPVCRNDDSLCLQQESF